MLKRETCDPRNLRASPRFVILSGEKRRMSDNECQNSGDLVIDRGEAATFILNSSFKRDFHP